MDLNYIADNYDSIIEKIFEHSIKHINIIDYAGKETWKNTNNDYLEDVFRQIFGNNEKEKYLNIWAKSAENFALFYTQLPTTFQNKICKEYFYPDEVTDFEKNIIDEFFNLKLKNDLSEEELIYLSKGEPDKLKDKSFSSIYDSLNYEDRKRMIKVLLKRSADKDLSIVHQ